MDRSDFDIMRIGYDARYLSHGIFGGVHTYVKLLVPAMIEHARDHDIFVYADTKRSFELDANAFPKNVTLRLLPYRNALSSILNDVTLQRQMEADKIEVAHFPANVGFAPKGTKAVVTLHDAINIMPLVEILRGHQKKLRTMTMMTYLHWMSTETVRRAQMLLTVSNEAKRTISKYTPFQPERIVAVTNGPDPKFKRIEDPALLNEVRTRYNLQQPFVLADGLKNPGVLTRAWKLLTPEVRDAHRIVFFSRRPDPPQTVLDAVSASQAHLLVRPSTEDLIALYSLAQAFIFPSWIEGLGLPLLEAMHCGAPVIASDRGSIPEVAGDAALFTDAEDENTLAQHITRVLTDAGARADMRMRGYARAATFTWPKTAERVMEAYRQAMTIAS